MKEKLKQMLPSIILSIIVLCLIFMLELDFKISITSVCLIVAYIILEYSIGDVISKFFGLFSKSHWKRTQRKLEKEGILQEDTIIRISFAYLFRIKIDDKYFLVKSKRTRKYQPVGGAYKFNKEEANYLSLNIPVENDDCIPVNEVTKRDYRLLVKNKYLRQFIRRFNKTSNRENIYNLSREFNEEIFNTGILKQKDFGSFSYRYCGRHITDIEETVFKPFEILLADIVEVILTDSQERLFRNLMNTESEEYLFCTAKEIKSCGVKTGTEELRDTIANHTYKILIENTDKLTLRNKYSDIITVKSYK